MEARRKAALGHLEKAVQELGPVVEASPGGIVREPLLFVIDELNRTGSELRNIEFETGPTWMESSSEKARKKPFDYNEGSLEQ